MKIPRGLLLAVLVWAGFTVVGATAQGQVVLVADGQARAVVVLGSKADEHEQLAAAELVAFVEKISGAKLPVLTAVHDSVPHKTTIILIGTAATEAGAISEVDMQQAKGSRENTLYPPDGFVLLAKPGTVALAGVRSDGTLFAAYELLERLGCRWFFPGELGQVVPRQKTITLETFKTIQRPSYESRQIRFTGELNPASVEPNDNGDTAGVRSDWLRRNKLSLEMDDPDRLWQHLEFKDPEDPAELKVPVERVEKFFKANPQKRWYSLCWVDTEGSQVSENQALGVAHLWDKRYHATDAVVGFTNKVARKVLEDYPGRNFTMLAYMNYITPPIAQHLDPSVGFYLCPIEACSRHVAGDGQCWQRDAIMQNVKSWCALSDKGSFYDFEPPFLVTGSVPMSCVSRLRVELPLMNKYGLRGYHSQTQLSVMNTGPDMYIRAKLFWDVNCNVDALLDDYYAQLFGPAAQPVREYWDALEYMFHHGPGHQHEDEIVKVIYPIEKVSALEKHIKRAEALARVAKTADSDLIRRRVQMIRFSFDNLMLYLRMRQAEDRADFALAKQLAQQMLEFHHKIESVNPVFYKIGDLDRGTEDQHAHLTGGWIAQNQARDERINGTLGGLLAMLPDKWDFKIDPHQEGIIYRWFDPSCRAGNWQKIRTTRIWEVQGYEDKAGHGYDGVGWYRTVAKVPAEFAGRKVKLNFGGVFGKMLVWVNGKFVAYRPFKTPWWRSGYNLTFDIDASDAIKAGSDNVIVVRVDNEIEWGGIFRRVFLWSPKGTDKE